MEFLGRKSSIKVKSHRKQRKSWKIEEKLLKENCCVYLIRFPLSMEIAKGKFFIDLIASLNALFFAFLIASKFLNREKYYIAYSLYLETFHCVHIEAHTWTNDLDTWHFLCFIDSWIYHHFLQSLEFIRSCALLLFSASLFFVLFIYYLLTNINEPTNI